MNIVEILSLTDEEFLKLNTMNRLKIIITLEEKLKQYCKLHGIASIGNTDRYINKKQRGK
jgi:hypothetical protein